MIFGMNNNEKQTADKIEPTKFTQKHQERTNLASS